MNEEKMLKKIFHKTPIKCSVKAVSNDHGISTRIASKKNTISLYTVDFSDGTSTAFIGKYKSAIIIAKGAGMLSGNNFPLFLKICLNNKAFGFQCGWKREALIYNKLPEQLQENLPTLYGADIHTITKKCLLALEPFEQNYDIDKHDVYRIIDRIIPIHNYYYNKPQQLKSLCINHYSISNYRKIKKIFKILFNRTDDNVLQILGADKVKIINNFVDSLETEYERVNFHQTLTHNDFSNRNIAVSGNQIIFYDWEMSCFQNPEHDIIELILSVMDKLSAHEAKDIFDYHKKSLPIKISDETYQMLLRFNLLEFCVNKLSLLRGASLQLNLDCAEQTAKSISTLMDILHIYE